MAEISFALLLEQNLKLKGLPLKQIETVITITGADDPQTLQKMRESVKDSFLARRKNLNDLIATAYSDMQKLAAKDKVLARKKKLDEDMKLMIATFEKDLNKRVADFCSKDAQVVQEYNAGRVKWAVKTAWALYGIVATVFEAATEGPQLSSLFDYIDTAKEIVATARDLITACQSENTVRDKIEKGLAKVKAIKPPATIPKDVLEKIELDIKVYKTKLGSVEMTARKASQNLQALLTKIDKSKDLDAKKKAQAEKMVDAMINRIIDLNEGVDQGKKFSQSSLDKIKNFEKRAKENPQSYWQLLCKLYEEAREKYLDARGPQEYKDVADQFVKLCTEDKD